MKDKNIRLVLAVAAVAGMCLASWVVLQAMGGRSGEQGVSSALHASKTADRPDRTKTDSSDSAAAQDTDAGRTPARADQESDSKPSVLPERFAQYANITGTLGEIAEKLGVKDRLLKVAELFDLDFEKPTTVTPSGPRVLFLRLETEDGRRKAVDFPRRKAGTGLLRAVDWTGRS